MINLIPKEALFFAVCCANVVTGAEEKKDDNGFYLITGLGLTRDYSGYQVIKTFPKTEEEVKFLQSIEDKVEIWTPVPGHITSVDLMLSPNQAPVIKYLLDQNGIKYSIIKLH